MYGSTKPILRTLIASVIAMSLALAPDADADPTAKQVPGQWITYTAPAAKPRAPDEKLVVFVPERKPEPEERIPPRPPARESAIEHRCAATWQWSRLSRPTARGAWAPNPSGDGRWVWLPKKGASGGVPPAVPDATVDYEDEFYFCAKAPSEAPWQKEATGKLVPGSWVTLVDGKKTLTLFVANTSVDEGDYLPELPKQERRIACNAKRHPRAPNGMTLGRSRPAKPFGRWVPEPFGSKRWAWVPSTGVPFALRPSASPSDVPAPVRAKCSWFDDAD